MLQKEVNKELGNYNTFGIEVRAEEFFVIEEAGDFEEAFQLGLFRDEFLVIGGGSNLLFTDDIHIPVIHIKLAGYSKEDLGSDRLLVSAGAGMDWDDFVARTLHDGCFGLENLSLIPGNVGASPVQNIGAYGVELMDVFHSLEAFDTHTGSWVTFKNEDCDFSYRSSIFKTTHRGRYIITKVRFLLSSQSQVNIAYGSIKELLQQKNIVNPSPMDVREAVISIRQSKLPDPEELGNAGSFFKNPVISKEEFERIYSEHPEMPFYALNDTNVKLAAGWLIDQCGLKGFRQGKAGVHEKQALVLVNHGGAKGKEILELAGIVRGKVADKFGILLEPEVNIIGGKLD